MSDHPYSWQRVAEERVARWRAGKEEVVSLSLPVLGTYSATAPYDCAKSKPILEQGCKALAARMLQGDYEKSVNAITRSLNALGLLASGNPEYMGHARRRSIRTHGHRSLDARIRRVVLRFSTNPRSINSGKRRKSSTKAKIKCGCT